MTEQERVDAINATAAKKLDSFLEQLENGVISEDEMLAITYAAMILVSTLGYNPIAMAEDALIGANKLMGDLLEELEDSTES
jgi:hypothetical protein